MADLQSLRVIVAGGGAVGSATALELAARGAAVTLTDPAPVGANASGVAAGMLAPAMEAALDPLSGGHFALFKAARELWPDFIERHRLQVEPHRCGAVWTGGADAAAKLLGIDIALLERKLAEHGIGGKSGVEDVDGER